MEPIHLTGERIELILSELECPYEYQEVVNATIAKLRFELLKVRLVPIEQAFNQLKEEIIRAHQQALIKLDKCNDVRID